MLIRPDRDVTSPLSVKPVVDAEPPSLVSRVNVQFSAYIICFTDICVICLYHNLDISFLHTHTHTVSTPGGDKIMFMNYVGMEIWVAQHCPRYFWTG